MNYECITHFRQSSAFCEHRLDGVRVAAGDGHHILVPNQNGPWTPWQIKQLIQHDLLVREPAFARPPVPVSVTALPSFCFVHADFMRSPGFMIWLDRLFDSDPPQGYQFRSFTNETMAHLVHWAGAFDSIGNARRNGWNKPVPSGFSMLTLTKRKIAIAILNCYEGMNIVD